MNDIERLRHVLAATGPPPDAQELSELLWLACRMGGDEPSPPASRRVRRVDVRLGLAEAELDAPDVPTLAEDAALPGFDGLVPVLPRPAVAADPAPVAADSGAEEVLVPTAPMLADPRGVQRALRPLKRRVPSRHRRELDEDATAARIAESGMWAPVLVPAPERWLTLGLVVDTGPTMRLWRPLARELAEALTRQGSFQDVHVSYLDGDRVSGAPGAPPRAPGTLLHASGRHAVFVLSDCSGPHWWDGRAHRAVRRWARTGPTAILQPLPERLWRRTAAPTSPGIAFLPRPGGPNTDLCFTPFDGVAEPGVPVPVLEIAPRWLGAWAGLVAGAGPQPLSVASLRPDPAAAVGPQPARGTAVEQERELPVDERVRRFLASASPAAAELAAHVAVSVPSLPVMRLIQHRVLGGSGPGQLAEVLLSGLLRPVDDLRYAFVPGAREALLDTLPRPEAQHTRHVLEAVSAEIERRAGTTAEVFRALVPSSGGRVRLVADTEHFALVSPRTRAHLAPSRAPQAPNLLDLLDRPVGELVGGGWGPLRLVPIGTGEDGGPLFLDIASGDIGRHTEISAPREVRGRWLRTILFSLAVHHSPSQIEFAFVDLSGGASFTGLGTLPHVAAAVHAMSPDSDLLDGLEPALDDELTRREGVLRDTGLRTWRDHEAAVTSGDPLDALPLLLIVLDSADALFEARPALSRFMSAVQVRALDAGVHFILCTANRTRFWNRSLLIAPGGGEDDGHAELRVPSRGVAKRFRPALITLDDAVPIIDRMAGIGPRARRLPWPVGEAPWLPPTGLHLRATGADARPAEEHPESAARLRDAPADQIKGLARTLDFLRDTEAEARRVRDEVAATIAGPPPPVRPERWAALADRLSALGRGIRTDGDRTDRARHITDLERAAADALRDARETVEAARDLLERREELRGRLDAHRRTADRWGLAEDDRSYRLYKQALTVLLATPCDLEEAEAALEEFERAVSPPDPTTRPSTGERDRARDVLTVNRGGEPRGPVIGFDERGDAVFPFPPGHPTDVPHGMIVGDAASRQRMLRVLVLALAATHLPDALSFAFGGMGEHPLGVHLDLPHVVRSKDELLGRPDELRRFLGYLSGELDTRASVPHADRPHLVVVIDVSVTLPPSRPEVADTLLRLARRGKAVGVTLVLSSETVDDRRTWDWYLPLIDWRIVTGPRPPMELQRFLRRPAVDFTGDRSAYLLVSGAPLLRFTIAREPSAGALGMFVEYLRAGRPAEPQERLSASAGRAPSSRYTILACDIASFGDALRTDDARAETRNALYRGLDASLRAAGTDLADCYHEDRGDGALVLFPPEVGTELLLTVVVERLNAELRRYNQAVAHLARIRLRVAVHTGEVRHDGNGVVGEAVNHAFRILDAQPFKDAFSKSMAPLGVVVSQRVHDDVVRHGPGLIDPNEYRPIDITVEGTGGAAWVRVPGVLIGTLAAAAGEPAALAGPSNASESPESGDLDEAALFELVDLMVDVPLMAGEPGRNLVMEFVRGEISSAVPRHAEARRDVYSILSTCLDHPGGLRELLTVIKQLSGESAPVLRLEEAAARIHPRP
ncbi:hypothetical protein GCM10010182_40410 [Actinomadura cremea]|nr:hypothetical protein GCM10010182_40410 [Actinomadura cremea]